MPRFLLLILPLTMFLSMPVSANQAPTVSAGPDTAITLGVTYYLRATVSDDSLTSLQMIYQWTQLSGPVPGASISVPVSRQTMVTFTAVGTYVFEIAVSDSHLTTRDTVNVMVGEEIPFVVTAPAAGASVRAGDACTVSWEMYPPASVFIRLTVDDGLSWEDISGPIGKESSTWVWNIPDSLSASSNCRLDVINYFERDKHAESGTFSIGATTVTSPVFRRSPAIRGNARVFSIDGRRLSRVAGPSTSESTHPVAGVVLYATRNGDTGLRLALPGSN